MKENARSKPSFKEWLSALKTADWKKADDIQSTYSSSDLLGRGSNRVVFDIGGNKYRMICKYAFGEKMVHVFICWMGTHAEYDKLNKENKQYIICKY